MLIGAIEAGGTKMVCAIATEKGEILERMSIPTQSPDVTLRAMLGFFKDKEIAALGIGSFGPVDLNPSSPTYGYITSTPKPGWANRDFVGTFSKVLNVPVGFDTDVNAAILGEVTYGAARNASSAIYITVGTGVGVGVCFEGKLLHGLVHPEAGHVLLMKHPSDNYKGKCPFHTNCVEGLASGPAVEERWGSAGAELADRPEVWELESYYVAQAVTNYILCYSPEKVILWGGIMHQSKMFELVRKKVKEMLGGYVASPVFETDLSDYIIPPGLGENPGVMGAVKLGLMALEEAESR